MNKQNGITLIALIITIIVMLILVGVTINVALNGGLIEKARTAGEQTQKQVEKEELITIAIGAYSSKNDSVLLSELTSEIDTTKFKYDSGKSVENSTYVVEGVKSGIFWEINLKSAEVKEYKEPVGGGDQDSASEPVTEIDQSIVPDIAAHYNEMVGIGDSSIRKADNGSYGDSWKRINGDLHTYYILTVEDASKGNPLIYDNKLVVADFANQQVISFEDSGIESSFGITATQIQTELNSILNPGT